MATAREFIQTELDGFKAILARAYRPPCGERKTHTWPKIKPSDDKPVDTNKCTKCGWSRASWKRLGKKDTLEITARVARLEDILSLDAQVIKR